MILLAISFVLVAHVFPSMVQSGPTDLLANINAAASALNLRCEPGWSSLSPNARCYKHILGGLRTCSEMGAQSFTLEQMNLQKTTKEFDFVERYLERLCLTSLDCQKITMAYRKKIGSRTLMTRQHRRALHSTKLFQVRYGINFPTESHFGCLRFTVCCPFQDVVFKNMEMLRACPGDYGVEDDSNAICVKREISTLPNSAAARLHRHRHQNSGEDEKQLHSINALFRENRGGLLFILVGIPTISIVSLAFCFTVLAIRSKRAEEQMYSSDSFSSYSTAYPPNSYSDYEFDKRSLINVRTTWEDDLDDLEDYEDSSLLTDFNL